MNNLLLDELPWIDQLREYYTAQLIGHMLADPDKAIALHRHFKTSVIAPQLPLTLDQKEFAKVINELVEDEKAVTVVNVRDALCAPHIAKYLLLRREDRELSTQALIWNFWPGGAEQPLEPWAKVLKDSAALLLVIGAHHHVEAATEHLKLLRIAPALEKLKAAVWLLEQHHNP